MIIAQIIGIVAFFLCCYSYYTNNKIKIFQIQGLVNILEIIHYILLGAYNGLIVKVIALLRNIVMLNKKNKYIDNIYVYIIFIITYIILMILNYKNIYSTLPYLAAIIYFIYIWKGNVKKIKWGVIISAIPWLIYDIHVLSIGEILKDIFSMIIAYISIIKYKKEMNK